MQQVSESEWERLKAQEAAYLRKIGEPPAEGSKNDDDE